jgi:uncharacterized protein (DUF952 family)
MDDGNRLGDEPIFHIATAAEADRLHRDGELTPASLADEGFVHCSTASQVVATTGRYFECGADLVLVELDPATIDAEVSWPEVYPSQRFPHVHGPLIASWVVALHPWREADRRSWQP